jgi:hypothetical protein
MMFMFSQVLDGQGLQSRFLMHELFTPWECIHKTNFVVDTFVTFVNDEPN